MHVNGLGLVRAARSGVCGRARTGEEAQCDQGCNGPQAGVESEK